MSLLVSGKASLVVKGGSPSVFHGLPAGEVTLSIRGEAQDVDVRRGVEVLIR